MKRNQRPDITAAEAARVGEALREARLTLGASVEDMAARLRINRRYIHALEEGRVKDLPGTAYAVGFVRSYATALGLDADEAVRRFRDVTGGAAARPGYLVFPEAVPSRGVPAGALVAAGVVVAIVAYVAWYNWSGSGNRVVDAVPPLPERLEQVAPAAPREPAAAQAAPPAAAGAAPPAAGAPAAPPAAGAPRPGQQQAAAPAPPATPAAPPAVAPAAAPAANEPRVQLRARGESWVQVRDTRSNQVILDRVLRSGESWPVPAREGLVLTTGRAENLDVVVDGQASGVLAGVIGVRRGIPLDADRLRTGPETGAPARP
jgi:cytoskeleton protein RodZ